MVEIRGKQYRSALSLTAVLGEFRISFNRKTVNKSVKLPSQSMSHADIC